jgi:hypothetical protein
LVGVISTSPQNIAPGVDPHHTAESSVFPREISHDIDVVTDHDGFSTQLSGAIGRDGSTGFQDESIPTAIYADDEGCFGIIVAWATLCPRFKSRFLLIERLFVRVNPVVVAGGSAHRCSRRDDHNPAKPGKVLSV